MLASVDLAAPDIFGSPDIAYVVVTGSKPVVGTAVYRSDVLLALLPLADAPVDARGPHVQPDF